MNPRFSLPALVLPAMLALGGGAHAAAPPEGDAFSLPATSKHIDAVDIPSQVKPALLPNGHPDPAFYAEVGHPSPTYQDFFGVQALADTTRAGILRDFVPAYASPVGEDAHSLTLRFKDGYALRFFPHSALALPTLDTLSPLDHAYVSGATWREQQAHLSQFRALLKKTGLAARYLVPDPLYADQREAARLIPSIKPAKVELDPDLAAFDKAPDAVLLAPEHVHGDDENYRRLAALLETHAFDWLGMEMLSTAMQPTLDTFNQAPEDSAAYRKARAALLDYFTVTMWNHRPAQTTTTGEDNYYFKLTQLARRRHVRLVGLEGATNAFMLFEYGEAPFGMATRNLLWAKAAPLHGHGAVFGGSAHFSSRRSPSVQDFLAARNPARLIVSTAAVDQTE